MEPCFDADVTEPAPDDGTPPALMGEGDRVESMGVDWAGMPPAVKGVC